jgi:glycerol-3-phosphate dehydrogenase
MPRSKAKVSVSVARKKRDADPLERSTVSALRDRPSADVLVIGGGINGIATFRDLSLQGVDVVLVERDDYLSGASSASSHMIHGGIRYLENGEFRLVSESVHERNGLLRNAPHYVKPLRTTIPIYSTFSGVLAAPLRLLTHRQGTPKERGALLIKVGLTLYDFFSRDGGTVPRHVFHGRRRSLEELPQVNPTLKYTATYFDASVHEPERLGLDVLADGLAGVGSAAVISARSANYVEAVGVSGDGILLRDRETGQEFPFAARLIVNASGPWTDLTNETMGHPTRLMGGTKGSHIVLDNPELLAACDGRELFFENSDGRVVLIHPLKGRVMVGTTDLDADPREPAICTEEEVDYFFELISHVFPAIAVDRSQIVFRFAGIRPLPTHDDTQPGFVSRDYNIVPGALPALPDIPVLSLVGGKWTTFRALGERLADEVLGRLGVARTVWTTNLAIGGGIQFPQTDAARTVWIEGRRESIPFARAEQLLERYGTRAEAVIQAIVEADDRPLVHDGSFSTGEIRYLARNESVVHLLDVVLRRTNHAFTGELTMGLLAELAELAGEVLGWDEPRRAAEVRSTAGVLADRHGMRLDGLASAHPAP